MKATIITFLLLFPLFSEAHEYDTMLSEGREWVYKEVLPDYDHMTEEQIIIGDVPYKVDFHSLVVGRNTLFDNKQCVEILHRSDGADQLFGYAYEEEGELYFYALCTGSVDGFSQPIDYKKDEWQMLYDFDAAMGVPTSMAWMPGDFCLNEIDTISVQNNTFVRQTWRSVDKGKKTVVGGIGSETGFLYIENITTNGASTLFVECKDKGEHIFSADDFYAIPLYVGGVRLDGQEGLFRDLQGRRVHGRPRPGVYIRGGRKQVVH